MREKNTHNYHSYLKTNFLSIVEKEQHQPITFIRYEYCDFLISLCVHIHSRVALLHFYNLKRNI